MESFTGNSSIGLIRSRNGRTNAAFYSFVPLLQVFRPGGQKSLVLSYPHVAARTPSTWIDPKIPSSRLGSIAVCLFDHRVNTFECVATYEQAKGLSSSSEFCKHD